MRYRQVEEGLIAHGVKVQRLVIGDDAEPRFTGPEWEVPVARARDLSLYGQELQGRFCAVVSAGSLLPAAVAVDLAAHLQVPSWIDFYGDPVSELHAEQMRDSAPNPMRRDEVTRLARHALARGDRFSSLSLPQRHSLLGQLGLLGRFRNLADPSALVVSIPCGVPADWAEQEPAIAATDELDRWIPPGSRVVNFGGSWNPWLDENAMGEALTHAFEIDPTLRLLLTAFATSPVSERIQEGFLAPIRRAGLSDRLIQPPQNLPMAVRQGLLSRTQASIMFDRHILESEWGSRNRLHLMARCGSLPLVTTTSEITHEMVALGLAIAASPSGAAARGAQLVEMVENANPADLRERTREWMQTLTPTETVRPLAEWLRNPAATENSSLGEVDYWARWVSQAPPGVKQALRAKLQQILRRT
jgi:hypothetical protein